MFVFLFIVFSAILKRQHRSYRSLVSWVFFHQFFFYKYIVFIPKSFPHYPRKKTWRTGNIVRFPVSSSYSFFFFYPVSTLLKTIRFSGVGIGKIKTSEWTLPPSMINLYLYFPWYPCIGVIDNLSLRK